MKIKYKARKTSEIRLQIAQKKKKKEKQKLRTETENEQNNRKFSNELRPKIDYISTIENRKRKKSFECQLNKRN